ncbi:hypothetical protein [Roseovarius sp. 2305UL8-3]|uniref:hypothetical protein n=1 Tax=Roseovarius conchicola TaxID=3121636 RepID=UPI003529244B
MVNDDRWSPLRPRRLWHAASTTALSAADQLATLVNLSAAALPDFGTTLPFLFGSPMKALLSARCKAPDFGPVFLTI